MFIFLSTSTTLPKKEIHIMHTPMVVGYEHHRIAAAQQQHRKVAAAGAPLNQLALTFPYYQLFRIKMGFASKMSKAVQQFFRALWIEIIRILTVWVIKSDVSPPTKPNQPTTKTSAQWLKFSKERNIIRQQRLRCKYLIKEFMAIHCEVLKLYNIVANLFNPEVESLRIRNSSKQQKVLHMKKLENAMTNKSNVVDSFTYFAQHSQSDILDIAILAACEDTAECDSWPFGTPHSLATRYATSVANSLKLMATNLFKYRNATATAHLPIREYDVYNPLADELNHLQKWTLSEAAEISDLLESREFRRLSSEMLLLERLYDVLARADHDHQDEVTVDNAEFISQVVQALAVQKTEVH